MNLFQGLSLSFLALVMLWEIRSYRRSTLPRGFILARWLVWLLAALAISDPNLLQYVANFIGIGRGADVVLYCFALLFLVVSFYFYARYVRLQRQVTRIIRHLAIEEAQRGECAP
jgi:small membrane protein